MIKSQVSQLPTNVLPEFSAFNLTQRSEDTE